MSDARAAAGFDRLPWLADEAKPRAKGGSRAFSACAVAAMLLVVVLAYWIGQSSRTEQVAEAPRATRPSTTVPLPEPTPQQPQVTPDRVPEVEPTVAPTIRRAPEPRVTIHRSRPPRAAETPPAEEVPEAAVPPVPKLAPLPIPKAAAPPALWPSRRSAGAAGRLIQIGAFRSRYHAKRGWWYMVGRYPALKRMPAVVVDTRNSRGRRFYRLQIGTTSQAQSEVLCQRMERIRYSCAVVGLPWKPKGVER